MGEEMTILAQVKFESPNGDVSRQVCRLLSGVLSPRLEVGRGGGRRIRVCPGGGSDQLGGLRIATGFARVDAIVDLEKAAWVER